MRGHCLGGGFELALSADIIVAGESAQFGLPETAVGLVPGGGATQLLRRSGGRSLALDLVLTGRRLTAAEARDASLVARVVPDGDVEEAALQVAESITSRSPVALRIAKETVNRAFDLALKAGMEAERRAFALALSSDDAREGIAAFLDKRQPTWP